MPIFQVVGVKLLPNWYIGGMTDWTEREFEIEFSFLERDQKYKMIIVQDGKKLIKVLLILNVLAKKLQIEIK